MFFIALTFLSAFAIEALGTLVSVIGLSTLFGANPIIIALAISLDAGKLVVVSLLYSRWKQMNLLMRSYALIAALVTMVITSAGAAGYLSGEFQKAILGTQEGATQVSILKEQITKYEARKKQIDDQIARIPDTTSARDRTRIIANFKAEQLDLQKKIGAIDAQLPALQVKQISVEAKAGPILYVAKAFNIPVEEAVKWVILMIIFVFDPLAVYLIIAGNFLLDQRTKNREEAEMRLKVPAPAPQTPNTVERAEYVMDYPAPIGLTAPPTDPIVPPPPPPPPPPPAPKVAREWATVVPPPPRPLPVVEDDTKIELPKFVTADEVTWPVVPEAPAPVAVEIPTPPVFEVLQPTPGVAEDGPVVVPSQPDASEAKVYTEQDLIDMGASPEVMVAAGFEPRELITKEQVLAQHFPHVSSLNAVKADETVTFDGAHLSDARQTYLNQL